jgi:hypothetical protein
MLWKCDVRGPAWTAASHHLVEADRAEGVGEPLKCAAVACSRQTWRPVAREGLPLRRGYDLGDLGVAERREAQAELAVELPNQLIRPQGVRDRPAMAVGGDRVGGMVPGRVTDNEAPIQLHGSRSEGSGRVPSAEVLQPPSTIVHESRPSVGTRHFSTAERASASSPFRA